MRDSKEQKSITNSKQENWQKNTEMQTAEKNRHR